MKNPRRVKQLFMVVRQDAEAQPTYSPRVAARRSKIYFQRGHAQNLIRGMEAQGHPAKLYVAEVSEWIEA